MTPTIKAWVSTFEQRGSPLHADAVALHDVGDLVAEQRRQLVVGEPEREHAAGDEDLPAGSAKAFGSGMSIR